MIEDHVEKRISDLNAHILRGLNSLSGLEESRSSAEGKDKEKLDMQIEDTKKIIAEHSNELESLQKNQNNEQKQAGPRIKCVPLIIVAMDRDEASELIKGDVFDHSPAEKNDREIFMDLENELKDHKVANWESHYKDRREDWVPYISKDCKKNININDIITEITIWLNQHPKDSYDEIRIKDISSKFFSTESKKFGEADQAIKKSGCILIVDSISLFHPSLRERLMASGVVKFDRAETFVLSPIDFSRLPPNCIAESLIKTKFMVFPSCYYGGNNSCKLMASGIGDLRGLKRWLFSTLPKTVDAAIDYHREDNAKVIEKRSGLKDTNFHTVIGDHRVDREEDDHSGD